jgi:hypothetical protein
MPPPRASPLLAALASDAVLERAFAWLCRSRRRFPPNADVWGLRRRWLVEKATLKAQLLAGHYRFDCLYRITLRDVGEVDVWNARDALPGAHFVFRTLLGFRVERDGLRVAAATRERFHARAARLYEQGRGRPEGVARLGDYVRRWRAWSRAGLAPAAAPGGAMSSRAPAPAPAYASARVPAL